MRILLANEARRGGGGVETYLASLLPPLVRRGHAVAMLYANPAAEDGPTRIETAESWSIADVGLDEATSRVRVWRPDVCFSHNMRALEVDERLVGGWPTVKMMHGYFGACLSGHKAFAFPSREVCRRPCDAGCLGYYLPRRCGQLRPDVMLKQHAWAVRQQGLFHRYAAIMVASDHMRREYLRYGVAPERVRANPLFASAQSGTSSAPADPIDVLFLGRMTPLKGPDIALRAAAEAAATLDRPLSVVLAGDGPERAALERIACDARHGGRLSVEFPGWVDAGARSALFARAAVVVVASTWPEPFGLIGLEAAEFGVPAVAFDVGGISEWLSHDVNGLIVPASEGAGGISAAIVRVLADPATRGRLSAGARELSRRLTADAHVDRLEDILQSPGTF